MTDDTDSTTCPNCDTGMLRGFYETLEIPAHSCILLNDEDSARAFPTGDLRLGVCGHCGFISNMLFDAAVQEYSTAYEEQQSYSPRFRQFQSELIDSLIERYNLREKTIVEIGCGKGDFLIELCGKGNNRGVGIDPASIPDRVGTHHGKGVQFIQELYDRRHADLPCDFLSCRHTLEHIHQTNAFIRHVRTVVGDRDDVVVFFEVPDAERVLREGAFWDIYYEHCSYFTLDSLRYVFKRNGFDVTDAGKEFDDQYLILTAVPKNTDRRTAPEPLEGVEQTLEWVRAFECSVRDIQAQWRGRVAKWQSRGYRVVVWGSGSKCVSFLGAVGNADAIACIVDINPHRHGRWLPGSGRQIANPESLAQDGADVVIIMNPIYRSEIESDLKRMGLAPEVLAV